MGSKFIEKHKRKSILGLLLLLFRGRSKYIALLVIVILFSLPFVATSDMIERFFGISAVRYLVKLFGLESVIASINPKYSTDIIKATFDRLKQETQDYNLWNKIGLGEENRGERGGLQFVKVDDEIFNKKEGKTKKGERDVDVGYSRDKEGGEGDREVDLDDIISGKGGGLGLSLNSDLFSNGFGSGFGGGLFGNSGFGGSSAFGKNTFGSYGPFIAKDTFQGSKNNFGVNYKGKGSIGSNALDNIKGNIPDVSNLSLSKKGKVKVSKMGSLTAYGWKNVGYTKKGAVVDVNTSGSRRALFQMGETLATTSMAYKQNPAYEYQAAYTGATYDGNSLNLDIVQTAGDSNTTLPDTGYVSDVIGSAEHWEEIAKKCQDAQAVHGTAISKLQDEIDNILKTMTNPPKCCNHGAVSKWNSKVSQLVEKCNQINSHSVSLANECGSSTPQTVNCQSTYGKLYIKPCSKWKCWLGFILAIVGALIGFLIGGFIGAIIGAAIGFALGTVASIYLQMAAMGAAFAGAGAYFADQKSQKAIDVVEDINKDVAKEK
jgi:hypothetical protein